MRIVATLEPDHETIGRGMVNAVSDNRDFLSGLDPEAANSIRTSLVTARPRAVHQMG